MQVRCISMHSRFIRQGFIVKCKGLLKLKAKSLTGFTKSQPGFLSGTKNRPREPVAVKT
jgi:hypothetical protein